MLSLPLITVRPEYHLGPLEIVQEPANLWAASPPLLSPMDMTIASMVDVPDLTSPPLCPPIMYQSPFWNEPSSSPGPFGAVAQSPLSPAAACDWLPGDVSPFGGVSNHVDPIKRHFVDSQGHGPAQSGEGTVLGCAHACIAGQRVLEQLHVSCLQPACRDAL